MCRCRGSLPHAVVGVDTQRLQVLVVVVNTVVIWVMMMVVVLLLVMLLVVVVVLLLLVLLVVVSRIRCSIATAAVGEVGIW